MTKLTYRHSEPRGKSRQCDVEILIEGHSGYGETGNDIVCAAISTLTYTLLNELRRLRANANVYRLETEIEEGKIHIIAGGCRIGARECFYTILTGFRMIEEHFPKNFQIYSESGGEMEDKSM